MSTYPRCGDGECRKPAEFNGYCFGHAIDREPEPADRRRDAMSTTDEFLAAAYERGRDAALAAASWVTDGNESDESRRRKLAMLEDGDPAIDQFLPNTPNLSGEWADDPTPLSLARDITGGDDLPEDLTDALADEFERGVDDHFSAACERELRD